MLLFLLQGSSPLEARQNPLYLQVFFAVLLLIIPLLIITRTLHFISVQREKKRRENPGSYQASFKSIKRAARGFGFNKQQTAFFDQICRKYRIHNPEFLLKNDDAADKLFRTIYHSLERSGNNENAENAKLLIFSIRQQIETYRRFSKAVASTQTISRGQTLSITAKKMGTAQSMVIDNNSGGLIINIPQDENNNEVRLPIFSRFHVYFQLNTGLSYSFDAFLLRYIRKESVSAMVLSHNKRLIPMHNRNFKRVEIEKTCYFSQVHISKKGKGANAQTVYTPLQDYYRATLIDISGGGCCMRTNNPVNQGTIISIRLQLVKDMEPVVSRVVRVSKVENSIGYILNIQFVRIKKSVRNMVYSFVYNYK